MFKIDWSILKNDLKNYQFKLNLSIRENYIIQ